jgi:BirA family biotin operon repressor/biotin-[acetyl-CoA-carboxylase] ligase
MSAKPPPRPQFPRQVPPEPDNPPEWAARLEQSIARWGLKRVRRIQVLEEVGSTQDAARELAEGGPGLVVLAARQTKGRGRLGRAWTDSRGLALSCSIVLDGRGWTDAHLSLASGAGVCRALESLGSAMGVFCLRWPNDVVVDNWRYARPIPGELRDKPAKIAGILIERGSGLVVVGIGINVLQQAADWPAELARRAVSLAQLGSSASRVRVAEAVLVDLERALDESAGSLAAAWSFRDVLVGKRAAFVHDGRRYEGTVVSIDPTSQIRVQLVDRRVVELPALTTSLVHDEPEC